MDLTAARRNFPPVLSLVLATVGLSTLYYATARPALLVIDGVSQQLRTHARRPVDLLLEAGIAMGADDTLVPDNSSELKWEGNILPVVELNQARPVVVEDEGYIEVVYTSETDPANLIDHQLFPGDRLIVNGLAEGSGTPAPRS
jgi:uncharacterized protein YabE (DUF348 family)